jgi:putative alpha-1,2-mannosidase
MSIRPMRRSGRMQQRRDRIFDARTGIEDYLSSHVPRQRKESAASTLEYAYDGFCVAQVARALGKQTIMLLSSSAKKLPQSLVLHWLVRIATATANEWASVRCKARLHGGNARSTWSVQQDIPGLIQLLGAGRLSRNWILFSTTMSSRWGYGQVIHESGKEDAEHGAVCAHQ